MKPTEAYTSENEQGLEPYQNRLMCVEINTALNQLHEQQAEGKENMIPGATVVQLEDKSFQLQTEDGTPVVRTGSKGLGDTKFVEFFLPGLKNRITKERALHKLQITSDEPSYKLIGDKKEFGYPENPDTLVKEINSLWGKQDATKSETDYIGDVYKTLYKQYSRDINAARVFLGLAVVATGAYIGNSHVGKSANWFIRNMTERGSFDDAFAQLLHEMGINNVDIKFSILDHTISGNNLDDRQGIIGELFPTFVKQAEQSNMEAEYTSTVNHFEAFLNSISKYKSLGKGSSQKSLDLDSKLILKSTDRDLDQAPIIATDGYVFDGTMINEIIRASLGQKKPGDAAVKELIQAVPYMLETIIGTALAGKLSEGTLTQLLGFCAKDVKLTNIIITSLLTGTFVSSMENYYEKGIKMSGSAAIIEADSELSIGEKMYSAMKSDDSLVYNEDDLIKGRNLIMALNTFGALKVINELGSKSPQLQFFAGFGHSEITGEFLNGEAQIVRQLEKYISTVTDNVIGIYKNLIQNETDVLAIQKHQYSLYTIMAQLVNVFPPYVFGNRHIINTPGGIKFPISEQEIITPQQLLLKAIRQKAQEDKDNEFGQILLGGIGPMISQTNSYFKRETKTTTFTDYDTFNNIKFHEIDGYSGPLDKGISYYLAEIVGSAEVNGRELPVRISRRNQTTIEVILEADGVSIEIGLIHLEEKQSYLDGQIYNFSVPNLNSIKATTEKISAQSIASTHGTVPEFLKNASYIGTSPAL